MKEVNYWDAANIFCSRTLVYCAKFPECYRFAITGKIVEIARNIKILANKANAVYITNRMDPGELGKRLSHRIEILCLLLEEIAAFDACFELLVMALDIENDTIGYMRKMLSQIAIDLKNTDLKDIDINFMYCLSGDICYTAKEEGGETAVKSGSIKLKFSNSNKTNWLRIRNELEDRVKTRISKDRAMIRKLNTT